MVHVSSKKRAVSAGELSKAALAVIDSDEARPFVSKPASLLPLEDFLTIDCQEKVVSLAEPERVVTTTNLVAFGGL